MKCNVLRALSTLLLLTCSFSAIADELKVIDPWVRSAPPNAPALGVFMILENHSDSDLAVVGARTSLAVERVELHRTMMMGDVMKMVPQEEVPVASHSNTVLKPGSWHIMLISPEKVPAMGDKVELTLVLANGSEQSVEAIVRQGKMSMQGHDHEMKHQMKCNQKHEMKCDKKSDEQCKKKHEKKHEMKHDKQCEMKQEMTQE